MTVEKALLEMLNVVFGLVQVSVSHSIGEGGEVVGQLAAKVDLEWRALTLLTGAPLLRGAEAQAQARVGVPGCCAVVVAEDQAGRVLAAAVVVGKGTF